MKRILAGFVVSSLGWSGVALAQQAAVVPGEYIVKLKSQSAASQQNARAKLAAKSSMKAAYPSMGMYHVSLKTAANPAANLEDIKADPDVEYVEPNYIYSTSQIDGQGSNTTQGYDLVTLLSYNWVSSAKSTFSQFGASSEANTQLTQAWSLSASLDENKDKVVVAVIDSGIDRGHIVFKPYDGTATGGTGALWVNVLEAKGQTGVDDDANGYIDDINGWNFVANNANVNDDNIHGTHVAGIVVGAGLNIFASPLSESKILVMPVKSLDGSGTGTTATAIRAVAYAVNNGAQVINNSWGGGGYSQALYDALANAYSRGILIVNAAGNNTQNSDQIPMYPASYNIPSSISVASVDPNDQLSYFSNYGAKTVHLGSPGNPILSTIPGGKYDYLRGTSMASPFVAGVAALALREDPQLNGYLLKQKILATVDQVSSLNGLVSTGGRIDASNLVENVQSTEGAMDYSSNGTFTRSVASEAGGAAAGCGLVSSAINKGPGAGGSNPTAGVVIGLMMIPMMAWFVLRQRAMAKDPKNQRRHERFKMQSQIKVMVGDRELVGSMNTISQGGLSFNTDQALEKGGVVTMRIASPDGHEIIEVQGQVVWSEANQSYGVQFANAKQGTLAMIQQWTSDLVKSS